MSAENAIFAFNMKEHIQQFLHYLTANRGFSDKTVTTYEHGLRNIADYLQAQCRANSWCDVDADMIRGWIVYRMEEGVQPRTIRRDLSGLSSLFRYLMQQGISSVNPMQKIVPPKAKKELPAFLKQSEMDRLLDYVVFPDTTEGLRDHLILLTFYSTGIRLSELQELQVSSVHFDRKELKVTGKRNKQRIIPFGKELEEEIKAYLAARSCEGEAVEPHSPLFVNAKGEKVGQVAIREMVKHYLSLVTTQRKRTPHVLRHTFATVMLNNGGDLTAVKELLGHESLATTEIYTHTSFAELQKEYQKAHPRAEKP